VYRWEKIDNNKVCMEIEVPPEEVNNALRQAYHKMVKDMVVPGFRKGKAPMKVLESRFGPEIFYEDALEILVAPAYSSAVSESKIEPISQPEMELVQIEKNKPLIFKVTVDVKPEVKLGQYKGVTFHKVKREITPEKVDSYLNSLREQHARMAAVEDGEAEHKDVVVIDFRGEIDGKPFEGGEAENYSLEIGSGTFVPGFEDQLLGARKEEDREVRITFPEDYSKEELAGKEALFYVKIKEIKKPQLPELDDNFVQELTEEFSTVEELKADVEKRLKEDLYQREKVSLESSIIEKVADEAEVEVPDALVDREIENMLGEFDYYLRMQGLSLEQYGKIVEGGLEKLKEERREEALLRARANLVLDAIIKEEGIEATDEEIDEKIKEVIGNQDADVEEVKEQFSRQGRLDIIAHEIRYRKVIDLLVEHANIVEVDEEEAKTEVEQSEAEVDEENTPGEAEKLPEEAGGNDKE